MKSKSKPKNQVGEIRFAAVTVPIMLDRKTNVFRIEIDDSTVVEDPTYEGARSKGLAKLKEWKPREWRQCIGVSFAGGEGGSHHSFGLSMFATFTCSYEFVRYERAETWDGQQLEREHEADVNERRREDRARGHDVHTYHDRAERTGGRSTYVELPYSEETWVLLSRLQEQFMQLSRSVTAMLRAPDLEKRLGSLSLPALPPAPVEDEDDE